MRIFQKYDPDTQDALELLALCMEYLCEDRDRATCTQQRALSAEISYAIQLILSTQSRLIDRAPEGR